MRHMIIIIQRVLSPLKKNKPWTLLSSFLNDNIRWDSAKLQKQKFIYLQTAVTSETKSFFFFFLQSLVGVSLASKHNKDPSAELFFPHTADIPTTTDTPKPRTKRTTELYSSEIIHRTRKYKRRKKNRLRRTLHCNICKMYRKENKRNHTRSDESVVSVSSNNFLGHVDYLFILDVRTLHSSYSGEVSDRVHE